MRLISVGKLAICTRVKQLKMKREEGFFRKAVVIGMLERKGEVRTAVINRASTKLIERVVKANVVPGSNLYSDEANAYVKVGKEYAHQVINHAEKYVNGTVHTNCIENYWSLLKRGLKGTYVSVEKMNVNCRIDPLEQPAPYAITSGTTLITVFQVLQ